MTSPSGRVAIHRLRAESQPFSKAEGTWTSGQNRDLRELLRGSYDPTATLTLDRVRSKIVRIGQNLFLRLFPEPLREVFRALPGGGRLSLLVESDEAEIPWELVHPDVADADFFCLHFTMARWLAQVAAPKPSFRVRRALGIESFAELAEEAAAEPAGPGASRGRAGSSAGGDLEILERRGRATEGFELEALREPMPEQVMTLLRRAGFDLLHFAGHSAQQGEDGDSAALYLPGGSLEARDLVGPWIENMVVERPFVFLNSCWAGGQARALTGLGGWPQRFVEICRSGGFLAPLWPVKNSVALRFARRFYEGFDKDSTPARTVGQAVRAARLAPIPRREVLGSGADEAVWADPSHADAGRPNANPTDSWPRHPRHADPRYLIYSYFGHPNARFAFGFAPYREPASRSAAVGPVRPRSAPARDRTDLCDRVRRSIRDAAAEALDVGGAEPPELPPVQVRHSRGVVLANQLTIGGDLRLDSAAEEPSAEKLRSLGTRHLRDRSYAMARQVFLRLIGEQPSAGDYFRLALAVLGDRRPRVLGVSELEELDAYLSITNRTDPSRASLLFQALARYDFYVLHGFRQPSPRHDELMQRAQGAPARLEDEALLLAQLEAGPGSASGNPAYALAVGLLSPPSDEPEGQA